MTIGMGATAAPAGRIAAAALALALSALPAAAGPRIAAGPAGAMAAGLGPGGMPGGSHALLPVPGAFGPLMAARYTPEVELALVPGDLIGFLERRAARGEADAQEVAALRDALGALAVLPGPVLHLVARGGVAGLADLAGRRVAVAPLDDPASVSAALVLDAAGVRPARLDPMPRAQALAALAAGGVDAVLIAARVPDAELAAAFAPGEGIRLLPLAPDPALPAHRAVELPAGSYPWAAAPVASVAVDVLMIAWAYPAGGPICARIAAAAAALSVPGAAPVGAEGAGGLARHGCLGPAPAPATGPAPASATSAPDPEAAAAAAAKGAALLKSLGSLFGGGAQ